MSLDDIPKIMSILQFGNVGLNDVLDTKERIETAGSQEEGLEWRIGVLHFGIGFILEGSQAGNQDAQGIDIGLEGIGSIGFMASNPGGWRPSPTGWEEEPARKNRVERHCDCRAGLHVFLAWLTE